MSRSVRSIYCPCCAGAPPAQPRSCHESIRPHVVCWSRASRLPPLSAIAPRAGHRARALRQRLGREDHGAHHRPRRRRVRVTRRRPPAAKCCASRRRPRRCRSRFSSTTAGGAHAHRRHPPRADLVRRAISTASARSRSSAIADRPTIFRDYTTDAEAAATPRIGKVFAMPGSGATLLDAIVEDQQGPRQARGRSRRDRAAHARERPSSAHCTTPQVLEGLKPRAAR